MRLLKALFLVSKLGQTAVKSDESTDAPNKKGMTASIPFHEDFESHVKICLQACNTEETPEEPEAHKSQEDIEMKE